MKKYPTKNIRNFGIIAHIDHGKSTLSDRLLEFAGNISKEEKHQQVLDRLPVERERGITVKAQTASLFHEHNGQSYLLNLIDTPGHVDFSYEVNRSLAACQGVILLVDANQGVQAQTVANFNLAYGREITIIPVLNKIDLKNVNPEAAADQMVSLFGFDKNEILKVSAKLGTGVTDLVTTVIEKIPPPPGCVNKPFRALLYDSWFDLYRGAIAIIVVVDGHVQVGDQIVSHETGTTYVVKELGILFPEETPVLQLFAGQAGYIVANMRNPQEARIGDTLYAKDAIIEPLPQVESSKPMVFSGIFPSDQSKLQELQKAIGKLTLNDSSVHVSVDSSPALGQGWRLGFLGLLHMEVFCQRLDKEFDAQVIVTTPGVPYKARLNDKKSIKEHGSEEITFSNPLEFPDPRTVSEYLEPMVLGTIITPDTYYSSVLRLCMDRRGEQKNCQSIGDHSVMLTYKFPLNEIIVDFFDELKSLSSGFASFDYEELGYELSALAKVEILLNGKLVEELTVITHATKARALGRVLCLRLKDNIEPHLFLIAIQAAVSGKVIAREDIRPLKKNVVAKLYGGDVTRRMKLLQKQAEGKKRMRMIGNIRVPRDAFIKVLKR